MDLFTKWRNGHQIIINLILFVLFMLHNGVYGLQGVPTWICLGLKSPFIEFKNDLEILSNLSISLNTSDHQQHGFGNSMMNGNPFSYPIDMKPNLTTQQQYLEVMEKQQGTTIPLTENPIVVAAMNSKKEVTLIEVKDMENGDRAIDHIDRKYIIPLALKTPTTLPTRKAPILPDSSPNIDDLKRHILMLQNLTKNDENFQSKFVVFPSLRNTTTSTTTTTTTTTTTSTTTQRPTTTRAAVMTTTRNNFRMITRRRPISLNSPKQAIASNEEPIKSEKITIVPQVFLQNDQTPMNDDSFERPAAVPTPSKTDQFNYQGSNRREVRISYERQPKYNRNNQRKIIDDDTKLTTKKPTGRRNQENRRNSKITQNWQRNDKKQLRRQMRKACKQTPFEQQQNCTKAFELKFNLTSSNNRKNNKNNNNNNKSDTPLLSNGSEFSPNGSRPKNNYIPIRNMQPAHVKNQRTKLNNNNNEDDELLKQSILQRTIRSHHRHQRRNATISSRDYLYPVGAIMPVNETTAEAAAAAYQEQIDLNPDLCYKVGGLSYGQQKLCVSHTQIMPAVSRGARASIQECKHQFKNRRWNCSTVDDNTVFGPASSIGSPEMAFVHAMAAAAAASFIARACRDGQLASCGCSRSSRPRQLHTDWTWGGCGDDLEFGYKFSQTFIDIREKERKRLQRGLVSIPPKHPKLDDDKFPTDRNDTNNNNENDSSTVTAINREDNPNGFKPEHLLELQEKITKEILSTKLREDEMHELQAKINHEILNSKVFNLEHQGLYSNGKKMQRTGTASSSMNRIKSSGSSKARSLMNLHNNEAGRRAMIKKSRITCKCHGVSGSCSLITCWQQLTSIREIGDYLREKYDEATQVKLNKRGRLQVKDSRYKVPTALDLVYLDESPDWCRNSRQLQWPGTHNRVCNKTSSGLDGCAILCCGRGYNTKKIVVKERCNCKFHWCCHVKCDTCIKVLEEHTCK